MDQEGRGAQESPHVGVPLLGQFSDTPHDGPGQIARFGRNLVDGHHAVAIPEGEVDKGSTNVHSHAVRALRFGHSQLFSLYSRIMQHPARISVGKSGCSSSLLPAPPPTLQATRESTNRKGIT